jgi:hypothetical protein
MIALVLAYVLVYMLITGTVAMWTLRDVAGHTGGHVIAASTMGGVIMAIAIVINHVELGLVVLAVGTIAVWLWLMNVADKEQGFE